MEESQAGWSVPAAAQIKSRLQVGRALRDLSQDS